MRWPWSKPDPDQLERLREAERAKEASQRELTRVREQWPEVHQARAQLDGLGVQIHQAMRGRT